MVGCRSLTALPTTIVPIFPIRKRHSRTSGIFRLRSLELWILNYDLRILINKQGLNGVLTDESHLEQRDHR